MERIQEPYKVQHFRCVTMEDGTVKKTPLSLQNIERQERRLQNEYRKKYGFRMKKLKANEKLSNERPDMEESKMEQMPASNPRYEEDKDEVTTTKKREEKKLQRKQIMINPTDH